MAKTILVCGYGPGISSAVAERFGSQGFSVALVARNAERLAAGVEELDAKGIRAVAVPGDLSTPSGVQQAVQGARARLGSVTVLHWNVAAGAAGDVLNADSQELSRIFDVPVSGLIGALREVLDDLRQDPAAALLVTNGGLGLFDPQADVLAVKWGAMGLALGNAAKHKLVGVLSERLKPDGVYVGEVVVLAPVKGTAWDDGTARIEPSAVAEKFWELYRARSAVSVLVG